MKVSFPVLLSSQIAMEKRLDAVANNVANSRTTGFRADATRFETVLSRTTDKAVAYVSRGENHISRQSGPMIETGNLLDVAVQGDVWLALQGPGGIIHTRDGRMRMLPTGELQSVTGHPVLDVGGAPLTLNTKDGPPKIARDGMITQGEKQIGAIGLFAIPDGAKLTRTGNSSIILDREAVPVIEFTNAGVVQGFVEQSNVNAVMELSRLIEVTRAFESLNSMIEQLEKTSSDAIKGLGTGS